MKYANGNVKRAAFLLAAIMILSVTAVFAGAPASGITPFTGTDYVRVVGEMPSSGLPQAAAFRVTIRSLKDGSVLYDAAVPARRYEAAGKSFFTFTISGLSPRLWTPAEPNLYEMALKITENGRLLSEEKERLGFRSFAVQNGKLYLNGKPVFLRGIAINPPGRGIPEDIERSRKFAEDYVRYMKSLHVNIIRIPDDETWYDVCDEQGMMVFGGNYSGSVNGEKPPRDYDRAVTWYEQEKFGPIAHHPSLMVYAMTNETPFTGDISLRWRKFLTYAHGKLQQWDSTRVYIGNAGYGYGQSGDICDLHRYWGWYYSSPFTFLHIRHKADIIPLKREVTQPITFTECVGNYTGPGGQYNLTPDHKNPGSQLNWTGHAPWEMQAQLADEHQCFTFRQATELFRQLRNINPQLSGVFPFTILFHNWNTITSFADMDPKAVAGQARISYQPVLLSWECWTPQVYAGATIRPVAHIINDDDHFKDLEQARLVYRLQDKTGRVLSDASLELPRIPYYGTFEKTLSLRLPATLPDGQYRLTGRILQGDSVISQNDYPLFIAGSTYVSAVSAPRQKVYLYDPRGTTGSALEKLDVPFEKISAFRGLKGGGALLLIGENAADAGLTGQADAIRAFVKAGGRVLCLRQDASHMEKLNRLLAARIRNITMDLDTPVYPPPPRPSRNGYNINPERPAHPVFSGIGRDKLRYWSDYTGWSESKAGFPAVYPVTDGFALEDKADIANTAVLADYGPALNGIAIAEMFEGEGSLLLCGMDLARRTSTDPVAGRLLKNMVSYMSSPEGHNRYPLISAPITWGDYASENGILTSVNSGLLLNGKPRLTGSLEKIHLMVTKEGYEFAGQRGGFNSRPGLQYLPYGRRPFGPYHLRGFGNIPEPDTPGSPGTGTFWCSIPSGKSSAVTLVWNPAKEPLQISIQVNGGQEVSRQVPPGATVAVSCPVSTTDVKMTFTGDRRLVLLQTAFR
ncbi:glycoside hydrolase family 2 TIM barrel-domain containing protein [Compostibacter hankyongensis]|uniref:Beta-galactosidase n=1 Tax=Compostibacter hankyongensis TaxID=1007089 RepID=A0ABP8FJ37_9BACT